MNGLPEVEAPLDFLVIAMLPTAFNVIGAYGTEHEATDRALTKAGEREGTTFGVFKKLGVAKEERQVMWRPTK